MTIILQYKNCIDGLASAYIAETYYELTSRDYISVPVQYGEDIESIIENHVLLDSDVLFVDFSADRDTIKNLSNLYDSVTILDHHKTAEEALKGLDDEYDNVEIIFDMDRSGAMIAYDYFNSKVNLRLNVELFEHIQDRDLWKFEREDTKPIGAALHLVVDSNDTSSFDTFYRRFKDSPKSMIRDGYTLLLKQDMDVKSNISTNKTKTIYLNGYEFICLNLTQDISETGNALCIKYNKPAAMYFITNDNKVVFSLRSTDDLIDASEIAKSYGGGGHRNACGFTISINELSDILLDKKIKN